MSQAIVKHIVSIIATYSETPAEPIRKWLKANGFTYKNGQWYKSHTESRVVESEESTRHMMS